ncbi:IS30 family transposase [Streptomyces marianii]|uniref:IS30 family transposase n=1 Tax=Streptomyces marianii TaxID=1817406 RepID=A0A5R9DWG3_9ACTN|nr:IS30 family transposase [Streptomyces marianii]TLQ41981.1 IS30 family transposase [Streptomyces marianii]TLQ43440.1 IS30 family transposase [Streptomyces marianii]TLQ45256.1 IS30 family transposase [Streptomyces marianii]TLQ45566.1 IS30 family transposase [Streptomyces marianii]TLQ45620.1 IS30 family transposase [Streptomyces marianii]
MDFEIRKVRTAQGPVKLRREREAYSRLVQQGYSNTEACRIVGVDRRTGNKWRNGRSADRRQKAAPPISAVAPPSGTSRYLREEERIHIADRLREKATVRAIAAELGRSPSTVSREIRRNRTDGARGRWHYRPHAAQARADARRPRPKSRKISENPELRAAVQAMLDEKWSPEQICHALRAQFPDRPEMHVVHETVYQALYVQGRGQLRRELAGALRSGRARRRPQRQANCRQPRFTTPMVMISERPAEIEDRAVPGHWEGDLIIGKDGKSAIGTLVERATRYVMLLHLPGDHGAESVLTSLTSTVQTLPAHLKRSLTWDQGSEMARHGEFTLATDIPVYFCDPASPWQRGSNENTNGLLRQYFPKGTDLSVHTPAHLAAVADQLNRRPRKTLGWETPAERLHKLLTA